MTQAPFVYSYDRRTGEYIGAAPAARNPASKTEPWMLPGAATWEAPPDVGNGTVAVFREGQWGTETDHRKEIWWRKEDGRATEITDLGEPSELGLISEQPPVVEPGSAAVWHDDAWAVVPDHRGAIWYDAEGNKVTVKELGEPVDLTPLPPDLRSDEQKLSEARAYAYSALRGALNASPYSQAEMMGFAAKEAEARDQPNGFLTPTLITAELTAEGIEPTADAVGERAAKIVAKANAARDRAAVLTGIRRRFEAEIAAAETTEALDVIVETARATIANA